MPWAPLGQDELDRKYAVHRAPHTRNNRRRLDAGLVHVAIRQDEVVISAIHGPLSPRPGPPVLLTVVHYNRLCLPDAGIKSYRNLDLLLWSPPRAPEQGLPPLDSANQGQENSAPSCTNRGRGMSAFVLSAEHVIGKRHAKHLCMRGAPRPSALGDPD